ncbi:MAG: class I SAM-dependent methyltransferase [Flavobacteriaceae bacterium]|nr:class I SAM-dependent methyltransferase [Flavobacteriaceae bacterium]
MDYENKSNEYYSNDRIEMLSYLPKDAKKILDVGCSDGSFASAVKERNNAEVWGIEYMNEEAKKAEKKLDKVFSGPCEKFLDELPDNYFDVIYFNDVLEHLVDPYMVLEKMKNKLAEGGVVISSIPNIRFHSVLIPLIFSKKFEYQNFGVMDKTHLRFFTKKSIKNMYENLGYKVISHKGINRTGSLRPILYNIPLLFLANDIRYPQFATVATVKK